VLGKKGEETQNSNMRNTGAKASLTGGQTEPNMRGGAVPGGGESTSQKRCEDAEGDVGVEDSDRL